MTCPRCSAELRDDQDWCLECGAPARTRLARTPPWRAPIAAVLAIAAVAGVALAFAFVRLSNTDDDVAARSVQSATQAAPPVQSTPKPSPFTTETGATGP